MARFRKKPVEIEAIQFNGYDDYVKIQDLFHETHGFVDSPIGFNALRVDLDEDGGFKTPATFLTIETLEGLMTADLGDWVIRGVKGEFYPCKPDIFEQTYDPV